MVWSLASWALAAGVCLALIWWGPRLARPVWRLLSPMWLPELVLILAGFALFGTDQGRDLGVSVLGAGHWQLFLLAAALVYWAAGSWLAARLGLNREFGADHTQWGGYGAWLRWMPRLLGVCAHCFAALSLALGARHLMGPEAGYILMVVPAWLLPYLPLAVIVAGTALLWFLDRELVARREARERAVAGGIEGRLREATAAYEVARRRVNRAMRGVGLGAVGIALLLYLQSARLPDGLGRASFWILASAVLFLIIVSHRRAIGEWIAIRVGLMIRPAAEERLRLAFEESAEHRATSSLVLATVLALIGCIGTAFAWWDPVSMGRAAGSMVIAFFAFGAYIAVIERIRLCFESVARILGRCRGCGLAGHRYLGHA